METKRENKIIASEEKERLAIMELAHMMSAPMSLVAVIKLKVIEAVWQDGSNTPLSATEILHRIRPNGGGDAENLQRILRLLTSYNIFAEHISASGKRKYSLTNVGKTLVPDSEGISYGPYMVQHYQEELMRAWRLVGDTVEDPNTEPFKKANGEGVLSYYNRREDASNLLGKAMYGMAIPFMREMLEQYDGFEGVDTLVDVGGNNGICLKMIMSKFPSIRFGINFDLPHSLVSAPHIPGVTHVGGSAFEFVPKGDAIFMKWLLVGFTDEECEKVFENCYKALPVKGKLIVCEPVAPELTDDSQSTRAVLGADIYVMTTYRTTKGKHRTEKQYKDLATSAAFHFSRIAFYDSYFGVFEFIK